MCSAEHLHHMLGKNWAGACFAALMERLEDRSYAFITICKDANNYYPNTSVDTHAHTFTVDASSVSKHTHLHGCLREKVTVLSIYMFGFYRLFFTILDLDALLFCFIFSKHENVLTTHSFLNFFISGFLWTLWGFVAAIKTWSTWQLDLMTFRLRASQAAHMHIKHLCVLKPFENRYTVTYNDGMDGL